MITAIRLFWADRTVWEKTAIALWTAVLLFVCVRVYFWPNAKTVYPIFSGSGRLWLSGIDIYQPYRPVEEQWGWRYSPTIAILFTPLALVPDPVGGVIWRLFSVAGMAGALWWLGRRVLPAPLSRDQFAWLVLLCTPLTLQSVNNGQANLVLTAALVGVVAALADERWSVASAMMALAFVLKLFPIALGMVLVLLYPRKLWWRIPLFAAIGLAVPFLCQRPDYVLDQYAKWLELLRAEDRSDTVLENMYRDLWLLIHIYGLPVNRKAYMVIQILGGILVAGLSWYRQRTGWGTRPLLTSTLALCMTWMMLLGPSPESSTFILLAPSLSWSIIEAWRGRESRARRWLLWTSLWLYVAAVLVGGLAQTVVVHHVGVHSWATLLYFVYLLTEPKAIVSAVAQKPVLKIRRAA